MARARDAGCDSLMASWVSNNGCWGMNVDKYFLDHTGIDWETMLSDWGWLLPDDYSVWRVSSFGDVFLLLPDGTVHLLDTGAGAINKVAESEGQFSELVDKGSIANAWLMIPLVDTLVERGLTLSDGQCYSFITPPGLGGSYEPENVRTCELAVHYAVTGVIFERVQGLADGTNVDFTVD